MDIYTHQKVFSTDRMQKYLDRHPSDQNKALIHYQANIRLSESFYPLLSVFEVSLRNSLNRELTKLFGTPDWYLNIAARPDLRELRKEINTAQSHITRREEIITGPKVVAELTLGFWIRILNVEYERILWKSLRKAFPFLPKVDRQRHTVSVPLNNIRNFRNRVYHNEPIAWNFNALEAVHTDLISVLGWLNNELPNYAHSVSRFNSVLAEAKADLK
jgi:hypothetical protein